VKKDTIHDTTNSVQEVLGTFVFVVLVNIFTDTYRIALKISRSVLNLTWFKAADFPIHYSIRPILNLPYQVVLTLHID